MSRIDELTAKHCPDGVEHKALGDIASIETGKLNANAAVEGGEYPFFTTAKEVSRVDKYRWDTEALLIAGNANVGDVKHYSGKFNAYQRTYVVTEFASHVDPRFLYFSLKNNLQEYLTNNKNEAAMTYIVLSTLQNFRILLPPLPVQKEIVRILDQFTRLEAELEAELEARKKQYDYYRQELLSIDDAIPLRTVGELCEVTRGRVMSKDYLAANAGQYPVYSSQTANSGIFGWIDTYDFEEESITWTTDGANAGSVFYHIEEKFSITNVCGLLRMKPGVDVSTKYLYHCLSIMTKKHVSAGMGNPKLMSTAMKKVKVPIPSRAEQERVVKVLDSFDALVNDLSSGLPAEIAARRKQYEYYRDQLLTFKELAS